MGTVALYAKFESLPEDRQQQVLEYRRVFVEPESNTETDDEKSRSD